jgi:putative membrane protein
MRTAAEVMIGIVAALHVYFFVLESFLFDTAYGRKTFKITKEQAKHGLVLARNQGVYNAFLAAGLVWGLVIPSTPVLTFFLICVIVAGIVGAVTANKAILFVQALPAAIALVLLRLA